MIAAPVPRDRPNPLPFRPVLLRCAALAAAALCCSSALAASPGYAGRSVDEVLHDLGDRGLRLIYSSETVPSTLRVEHEPDGATPAEILQQVLAEHGLRASRIGEDTYAIVRDEAAATPPAAAAPAAAAPLDEVVVSASRYALAADLPDAKTFLTQDEIEGLPRLADDSLKAVHRLPGAASNGLSGLAYIRGGEDNETLVVFDGLPLYDPFHLRLLLSPASLLDPRVLSSLDVHTGGYSAAFGDRMSAIIDATSVHPAADQYYEVGLSLFHANALASRRFADGRGQWLAAIRRSNLDEVSDIVDLEFGEPSYQDGFGRLDYAFSDDTQGSLHVLLSSDRADVWNAEETEFAQAEYRNSYLWATLEHDFSQAFRGSAILSYTDVASERKGTVNEPGGRVGAVDDERHYDVLGLKLDGNYATGRWLHRFGLELRDLSADYDYQSAVTMAPGYPFPDSPGMGVTRSLAPRPAGGHVAAYVTTRVQVSDRFVAEAGLRWDEQNYTEDSDHQLAPRMNLAWQLDESTRLLAAWGRFQQFQGINELQVEDGVDEFQPTQTADHAILGVEHQLPAGFALRVEAYLKDYLSPRPRYESLFDPRSLVPELRWDRIRIAPTSARAEGLEWLLTRRGSGPWSGWLNYAWSRVRDRVDGAWVVRSWDQTHAAGGGIGWSERGWQVTVAGTWHTGWPTTPVQLVDTGATSPAVAIGPRNSTRYPGYASLDLRVSRDIALSRGELTVFGEVTNALDRRNPCCTDYSLATGGDGAVALEREYRSWLPLVPSIGVLWRF